MKPPQHITAEGAGWEPGGVGGAAAATQAHLFSGRRVEAEGEGRGRVSPGYVRRGAQPPRYVPALPQPC